MGARIVESGKAEGTEESFYAFVERFGEELARQVELGQAATDHDYIEFQRTLSANVRVGPKTRHEILLRKLLLFDSTWAEALGSEALAIGTMAKDINRLGGEIATLIAAKNEEYSSKQGVDLFKTTNRTTGGLARLREPIGTYEEYSRFVNDLYFIFREGPGQRLSGNVPISFEDVNSLRTGLQHDLDHGKSRSVTAKRMEIGKAFAKYAAGATSPSTLAPERFPIVQAALLKAIDEDLRNLVI